MASLNCPERLRCIGQVGLADETLPLNIFVPILAERRIEDRGIHVYRRVSLLKCLFNRFGKYFAFEIERTGQYPDVAEILHSAVQNTELDHGLELFGDRTLHAG